MTEKDWNPEQIFIFGSNLSGIHGAGAAKFALQNCGAEWGIGIGLCGMSYAIPTKDHNIKTLPLEDISKYVEDFKLFAEQHPELTFQLTTIGCGLAGYIPEDIAPMFRDSPSNVILPQEFLQVFVFEDELRDIIFQTSNPRWPKFLF